MKRISALFIACLVQFFAISQSTYSYINSDELSRINPELWKAIFDEENTNSMISGIQFQMKRQEYAISEIESSNINTAIAENDEHQFVFASQPNYFEQSEKEIPCFGVNAEVINFFNNNNNWYYYNQEFEREDRELEQILEKRDCYTDIVYNVFGEDSVIIDPTSGVAIAQYYESCGTYYSVNNIDGIVLFEYDMPEENYPYADVRFGLVKTIYLYNPETGEDEDRLLITFSSSLTKVPNISLHTDNWYKTILKAKKAVSKSHDDSQSLTFTSLDVKQVPQKFLCPDASFDNHFGQVFFQY
jgi:hypothetical protein